MPRTTSVTLSTHFEEFIQKQLTSGRYGNVSEVIRESLRQMEDRETRMGSLRAALDSGVEQLDRGEGIAWDTLKNELDAG